MALKFTKATAPLTTAICWRHLVRVPIIAADSTALNLKMRQKFWKAERLVWEGLTVLGWNCLFHNVFVSDVQVDLICKNPFGLLTVIEVKMQGPSALAHVTPRQKSRLMRVCECLSQWEPVELSLAFVEGRRFTIIPVH